MATFRQRKAENELAEELKALESVDAYSDDIEDDVDTIGGEDGDELDGDVSDGSVEDGCPIYDEDDDYDDGFSKESVYKKSVRTLIEDPDIFNQKNALQRQTSSRIRCLIYSDPINTWININYRVKWFMDIGIQPDDHMLQVYTTYQSIASARSIGTTYHIDFPVPDNKHPGKYELRCVITHNSGPMVHCYNTLDYPKPMDKRLALKSNLNPKRVSGEDGATVGIHGLMPIITLYVDNDGYLHFSRGKNILTAIELSDQLSGRRLSCLFDMGYQLPKRLAKQYHRKQIQHVQFLKFIHKGTPVTLLEYFRQDSTDPQDAKVKSGLSRIYLVMLPNKAPFEVEVPAGEKLLLKHLKLK